VGNSGSQQAPIDENLTYLCVTDVQITIRKMGKPLGQSMAGQATVTESPTDTDGWPRAAKSFRYSRSHAY